MKANLIDGDFNGSAGDAAEMALKAAVSASGPEELDQIIIDLRSWLASDEAVKMQELNRAVLAAQAESTVWKKRLVDDTDRLRKILQADRDTLNRELMNLFPGEFTWAMLMTGEETTVQRVIRKLRESQPTYASADATAELERERSVNAAVLLAAEGNFSAVSDIDRKHPAWSLAFQAVMNRHNSSVQAVATAERKVARLAAFMEPENFGRNFWRMYRERHLATNPGATITTWDDMPEPEKKEWLDLAASFSQLYGSHTGTESLDDKIFQQVVEQGNAMAWMMSRIEDLQGDAGYKALEELDEFLNRNFPGFKADPTKDSVLDAPRRAVEILTVFGQNVPGLLRAFWNTAVRPALHALEDMGIQVLPPGTIVYGTDSTGRKAVSDGKG